MRTFNFVSRPRKSQHKGQLREVCDGDAILIDRRVRIDQCPNLPLVWFRTFEEDRCSTVVSHLNVLLEIGVLLSPNATLLRSETFFLPRRFGEFGLKVLQCSLADST